MSSGGDMSGGGVSSGGAGGASTGGGEASGSGGGFGGGGFEGMGGGGGAAIELVVRWQTALPVRQALLKIKYGKEVATSDEAKKFLAAEDPNYVIFVEGLPPQMMKMGAKLQEALKQATVLKRKDKEPIQAAAVQIGQTQRGNVAVIMFPRAANIVPDDKEVEFYTKLGNSELKTKFRLKDMMFGEKLAL